jgi:AcrR family transcriptional regulator
VSKNDEGRGSLRRRPTQPRARATFDALLDATAHLLAERGLGAVNTNAVARQAGVTPPTLYRYFRDKEALLSALAERFLGAEESWLEGLEALGDPTRPLPEAAATLLRSYAEASDAFPAIVPLRAAMRALPHLAPLEEQALATSSARLAKALRARLEAVPPTRIETVARTVVEAVSHGIDQSRELPEAARRRRRDELGRMVVAYLTSLEGP